MKHLIALLTVSLLTACGKSGGQPVQVSAAPTNGTSPAIVAPSTPYWPLAGALATVDFGGYSCSTFAGNAAKCYDGVTTFDLTTPLGGVTISKVAIGNNAACVFTDNGDPLTNVLTCWSRLDTGTAIMDQGTHDGFASPTYHTGPIDVTTNGSGDVCISYSVFDSSFNPDHDATTCGAQFTTLGYVY